MAHNREKGISKEKVEKDMKSGSEVKKKWLREEYVCVALGFVMLFGCILVLAGTQYFGDMSRHTQYTSRYGSIISFQIPIELMKILASVTMFLSIGRILLAMSSALYWVNVDEDELALLDEILEKELDEEEMEEEDYIKDNAADKKTLLDKFKIDK